MTSHVFVSRAVAPFRRFAVAILIAGLVAAGCSSDATDDVDATLDDAAEEAAETVDTVDEVTEEDAEELVDDAAEEVDAAAEDAAGEFDERSAAIAQVLRDNDMESLASAVEAVDATALLGDGAFTFFAPNDDAFRELDADALADLLSDPAELGNVLQNHVVTERIDSAALVGMTSVQTRAGSSLSVSVDGDTVTVGDATVVNPDIDAADGVIHMIDSVLIP